MNNEMYMYKNLFTFNNSTVSARGKGHNPSATARCVTKGQNLLSDTCNSIVEILAGEIT